MTHRRSHDAITVARRTARHSRTGLLPDRRARSCRRHRTMLGLLALPDERLPHLRGACSRSSACSARNYAGGPSRQGSVRSAARGAQHLDAAAVVDHLRLRDAGDAEGQQRRNAALARRHRLCWAPASSAWNSTSSPHLIHEGAAPQRSAFLSSFFTLVGTHGLHVTCRPDLAGRR